MFASVLQLLTGFAGVMVGALVGVMWAGHLVRRKTKRARKERAALLLLSRKGKKKKPFTPKQVGTLLELTAEREAPFREELFATGVPWALTGAGLGLLVTLLGGLGWPSIKAFLAIYIVFYLAAFSLAAAATYFYRRRVFVKGLLGTARAAGVPEDTMKGLAEQARAVFTEGGEEVPRGLRGDLDQAVKSSGALAERERDCAEHQKTISEFQQAIGDEKRLSADMAMGLEELSNTLGFLTETAQNLAVTASDSLGKHSAELLHDPMRGDIVKCYGSGLIRRLPFSLRLRTEYLVSRRPAALSHSGLASAARHIESA